MTPLPRIVERMLTRFAPPEWRDSIAGDLEEERARRIASGHRAGALRMFIAALRIVAGLRAGRRRAMAGETQTERRRRPMDGLWADVKQARRNLSSHRGYAAMAILTLALGIGATTAVFSLANWILLRPLPGVDREDRLVTLTLGNEDGAALAIAPVTADTLRSGIPAVSDLAGYLELPMNVATSSSGPPRRLVTQVVDARYFPTLGGRMSLGRTFSPDEGHTASGPPAAIISDRYWHDAFNGDNHALGQTLVVNGEAATIIGVAPAGFCGVLRTGAVDLWLPIGQHRTFLPQYPDNLLTHPDNGFYFVLLGRLREGAGAEVVKSQAEQVHRALADASPGDTRLTRFQFVVRSGADPQPWAREQLSSTMSLLIGVVAILLALTCANVANLVLGRATSRRAEIATRVALGAPRWRIARLLLVESGLLALIASVVAIGLAWIVGTSLEGTVVLQGVAPLARAQIDWRVLLFALATAAAAAVAAGVLPALTSARADVQSALQESGRSKTGGRGVWRRGLVITQVAASLTLLIGALLLGHSMARRHAINPGFDPSRVLALSLEPKLTGYTPERKATLYRAVVDRVRLLPNVRAAGWAWAQPYGPIANDVVFWAEGRPDTTVDAEVNMTSTGFFDAMGLAFAEGRDFVEGEFLSAKTVADVVIINESSARRLFGDAPAVGRRVVMSYPKDAVRTVVGVVRDMRQRHFLAPPDAMLFKPLSGSTGWATLLVGVNGSTGAVVPKIQDIVAALEPRLPVYGVTSMSAAIDQQLADDILFTRGTTLFAVLAAVLSAIGLYGVLARSVAERRREFSIRAALGATPATIGTLVSAEAIRVSAIGVLIGLALTVWLTKFLSSRLYGVERLDPLAFTGAVAAVIVLTFVATTAPARRAARVDPADELR